MIPITLLPAFLKALAIGSICAVPTPVEIQTTIPFLEIVAGTPKGPRIEKIGSLIGISPNFFVVWPTS